MTQEELETSILRDDFYRDSFMRVVMVILGLLVSMSGLLAVSLYIHLNKPKPVLFGVDSEWRIQPSVALDQPYISLADLNQWVVNALSRSFTLDFLNYNDQLENAKQFFTDEGWKVFLNQLNIYANYNNVQANKVFVSGTPAGAPSLINQGLTGGRFGWIVEIPYTLSYAGFNPPPSRTITLSLLIVRVSTLNNLSGVAIDNIVVKADTGKQATGTV